MNVLITGAAGNLGGLLAQYLKDEHDIHLNLMVHKKEPDEDLKKHTNVSVFKCDLAKRESLTEILSKSDVIVHFAGVLFKNNPQKFLPVTNTVYFRNLLDEAVKHNIKRVILISFPHVEGETSPEKPAEGNLNGKPESVHARTRLEEEKYLFEMQQKHSFEAVSLRTGMVYGKGILMIDTARWFAKNRILGIWKKPTWIHLISTPDFLEATKNAVIKDNIKGIFHLGDDGKQTLQDFLDTACKHWGYRKPVRMPLWFIYVIAWHFEKFSFIFGTRSPLTRDFVKIGTASYYGNTNSMKILLLNELKFKTYIEGLNTL